MVEPEQSPLAQRLWHGLHQRATAWLSALAPTTPPQPGMYTYHVSANCGQRRIHLRIEHDASAVLFIDVNDVVHLNATAADMAKLALDNVPFEQACTRLQRRFRDVSQEQLLQEMDNIYSMVDAIRSLERGCATCALAAYGSLSHVPLFSTRAKAPYKADIALTYVCNNTCSHCYNEAQRVAMPSLDVIEWYHVLDKLSAIGVPHIIFTGGEATSFAGLPELIRYADRCGCIVGLNTNGRRLSNMDYVQTLANAGLNHVQITLESCREDVHNALTGALSFAQTVKGIEHALASSLHTITNTTLMRSNVDHVDDIITFLHSMGVETFALNGMIKAGGGTASPEALEHEELAPVLIRVRDRAAELGMRFLWYTPTEYCRMSPVELELGAKRCNAAEYTICIEPNGDVLPCQSYYVSAGNFMRDSWEDIWNSELFRSFRERGDNPCASGLPEQCWDCADLSLCGGGCRLEQENLV